MQRFERLRKPIVWSRIKRGVKGSLFPSHRDERITFTIMEVIWSVVVGKRPTTKDGFQ